METIRNLFTNIEPISFLIGFLTMAVIGCINGIDKEKGGKKNVTHKL